MTRKLLRGVFERSDPIRRLMLIQRDESQQWRSGREEEEEKKVETKEKVESARQGTRRMSAPSEVFFFHTAKEGS